LAQKVVKNAIFGEFFGVFARFWRIIALAKTPRMLRGKLFENIQRNDASNAKEHKRG
jgi:hypothetical protein